MIVDAVSNFMSSDYSDFVTMPFAYSVDGAAVGFVAGVVGIAAMGVIASRDKDPSAGAALPFLAFVAIPQATAYGAGVGAVVGVASAVFKRFY